MVRILGVELPDEKRVPFSLMHLYGIGRTRAFKIVHDLKIDSFKKVKDLTEDEKDKIRAYIDANFKVEGKLREEKLFNIKRLKDIKCYRGIRHLKGLPTRGQQTKTNNRTVRGNVRKTVATAKKPPPAPK